MLKITFIIFMNLQTELECPICLDTTLNKDNILLNECGHIFHIECFKLWYLKRHDCPICRCDIPYHFICCLSNNFIPYFNKKYIIKIDDDKLLFYNIKKNNYKKTSNVDYNELENKDLYTDVFLNLKKYYKRGDIIKTIEYPTIKKIFKEKNNIRIELHNGLKENIYCNTIFKMELITAIIDNVSLYHKKLKLN